MILRKLITLAEQEKLPFWLLRFGVWLIVFHRYWELRGMTGERASPVITAFLEEMRTSAIALVPEKANEQHYEVPPRFYEYSLGKYRKYSSALFSTGTSDLTEAEKAMLTLTCQRAELQNGQNILELGCGWGSLSLWMATEYPDASITAVSNSQSQREYIEARAIERGIKNLRVITADINTFSVEATFDRVVSVEMFEHLRNWELLFSKIHRWLKPDGKLFFHIFVHREIPYRYETEGELNWMGRYFFSGGMMPCDSLPLYIDSPLRIESHERVSGLHYAKTARAWWKNMDKNRAALLPILEEIYGKDQSILWFMRWKLFYLACDVLFGFRGGTEWWVSHYRFKNSSVG